MDFSFAGVMSVLGIFDIANYSKWIRNNNFKVDFLSLNHPDCLDPNLIPHQFLQPLLAEFEGCIPPTEFLQLLKTEQTEVGIKLFEQYNYLKQYFFRCNIAPEKINNKFFQNYWTWLIGKVKNENRISI